MLGMGPSVPLRRASGPPKRKLPFRHEARAVGSDPMAAELHAMRSTTRSRRRCNSIGTGTKRRSPRQAAIASASSATTPARGCWIAAPRSTMPSSGCRTAIRCGTRGLSRRLRSRAGNGARLRCCRTKSRDRRAARPDQAEGRARARAARAADRAAGEGPRPGLMFGRGCATAAIAGGRGALAERLLVLGDRVRRQRIFEIVGSSRTSSYSRPAQRPSTPGARRG